MDVIGNNIANVNTTGYKSSSMVFATLMSQTTQRASGANALNGTGGTNARQIGLGVKSGAISVNITGQGASQSTGNPFDIMITGENFFIVNDGSQNFFTRDGSFYVDGAGNLAMTSLGYNVMGWQADDETGAIKKDTVSALRIMSTANMTYPPEATTQGYMTGIIDKHDTEVKSESGRTVNFTFFDELGYDYTAKFVFRQSDDEHEYSLELDRIEDSEGNAIDLSRRPGVDSNASLFGAASKLEKENKMTFNSNSYMWGTGTPPSTTLLNTNTNESIDLTKLIEGTGNDMTFLSPDTEINIGTDADPVMSTVQKELDKIAAAYGYEGKTDDFLNLVYTQVITPADPTATPPTEAVTADWTVEQLLLAQAGGTVTNVAGNNAPTLNAVFSDPAVENSTVTMSGSSFQGVLVNFDKNNGNFAGVNGLPTQTTVTLNLSTIGEGNFRDITLDLSELGCWNNKGTTTATATSGSNQDTTLGEGAGRRLGAMSGLSVQQNGMIYASYDNGMTKLLGQIATARFANASGLEKQADNLYSDSLNSGQFDGVGVDITANGDYMSTGQLEMSNVDLSSEFTEMITTQRGFQANSRIITVSDTLLEELTNLKR